MPGSGRIRLVSLGWLRFVIAATEIAKVNGSLIMAFCAMGGITLEGFIPRAWPAGKSMGRPLLNSSHWARPTEENPDRTY